MPSGCPNISPVPSGCVHAHVRHARVQVCTAKYGFTRRGDRIQIFRISVFTHFSLFFNTLVVTTPPWIHDAQNDSDSGSRRRASAQNDSYSGSRLDSSVSVALAGEPASGPGDCSPLAGTSPYLAFCAGICATAIAVAVRAKLRSDRTTDQKRCTRPEEACGNCRSADNGKGLALSSPDAKSSCTRESEQRTLGRWPPRGCDCD